MNHVEKGRRVKKRTVVSQDDKKALLKDFESKKIEIEDKKSQIADLEKDIHAAIPIIESILEDEDMRSALPTGMANDLWEFAERYV